MPRWNNSDRRVRLPADWDKRRKRVLRRDNNQCRWLTDNIRCDRTATEVDHIKPGDNHEDWNLQSLCSWHHGKKSGREGAAATAAVLKANKKKFQRTESHPGLVR